MPCFGISTVINQRSAAIAEQLVANNNVSIGVSGTLYVDPIIGIVCAGIARYGVSIASSTSSASYINSITGIGISANIGGDGAVIAILDMDAVQPVSITKITRHRTVVSISKVNAGKFIPSFIVIVADITRYGATWGIIQAYPDIVII